MDGHDWHKQPQGCWSCLAVLQTLACTAPAVFMTGSGRFSYSLLNTSQPTRSSMCSGSLRGPHLTTAPAPRQVMHGTSAHQRARSVLPHPVRSPDDAQGFFDVAAFSPNLCTPALLYLQAVTAAGNNARVEPTGLRVAPHTLLRSQPKRACHQANYRAAPTMQLPLGKS